MTPAARPAILVAAATALLVTGTVLIALPARENAVRAAQDRFRIAGLTWPDRPGGVRGDAAVAAFAKGATDDDLVEAARGRRDADLYALAAALDGPADHRLAGLTAHAALVDALGGDRALLTPYVEALARSRTSPAAFAGVGTDPQRLLVFAAVADADLRDYYVANEEWLAETLIQLDYRTEGGGSTGADHSATPAVPADHPWAELIRRARRAHPVGREAYREFGPGGLAVVLDHYELIRATEILRLKWDEVVEVLFANPPTEGVPLTAESLAEINAHYPKLWDAARREPGVLRLARDVTPRLAEAVYKALPVDNAAAFLYATWPDHLKPAAESLVKHGQGAHYVLDRYGSKTDRQDNRLSVRFGKLLNEHSWKFVLYVLAHGDAGLDEMEKNPRTYDKDFDEDGRPRDKEFWTKIPLVGAPADLARNWASGRPISWDEIGWAGLDLADGAMLVATLGASLPLTAAKGTAKAATREVLKETAKSAAKGTAKEAREVALKAVGKASVSLLKQWGGRGVASAVGRGITAAVRWMSWAVRASATAVVKAARAAGAAWAKYGPRIQKALLAAARAAALLVVLSRLDAADQESALLRVRDRLESNNPTAAIDRGERLTANVDDVIDPVRVDRSSAEHARRYGGFVLVGLGLGGLGAAYGSRRKDARREASRG